MSSLVQRDARTDPGFVLVKIDAHHFSLAHPDKIVEQHRLALFRPNKHHPQLGFRFLTVDRRDKRRVLHFLLQDPLMRIFQRRELLPRRFHIDAETSE